MRVLGRLVARLLWLVVAALVVVVAVTAVRVVLEARDDETRASDVLVVLGAAQFDGEPGPVLTDRLEHALDLYEQGVAPVVVTTGGNQPGDRFTEAGSGREWLSARGVPQDALVAVEVGGDTVSSLEATADVLDERGWRSAVVVTDGPHALRSRTMLADLGVDTVVSPAPGERDGWHETRYVVRETFAYLSYQAGRVLR
jgi:uncharacterized SAM-binding protein YcdF (DUF218 family)